MTPKKKKAVRRPRKPKPLLEDEGYRLTMASIEKYEGENVVEISGAIFDERNSRRLAAWLTKAADYLESVEGKK